MPQIRIMSTTRLPFFGRNPAGVALLAILGTAVCLGPLPSAGAQEEQKPAQKPAETQGPQVQEPPLKPRDVDSIATLIRYVGQKEAAVESLTMRLSSRYTPVPQEVAAIETELRVLSGTHQHARSVTRIGRPDQKPDIEVVTESVQTPEGLFLREVDPAQGELFLRMDQDLLERTRSAAEFLEGQASVTAPRLDPRGKALLGKAMLEELDKVFELGYSAPEAIGEPGDRFWVVSGAARKASTQAAEDPILGADRVSLLVREKDGVVTQLRAFERGRPVFEARILEIDLKPKLDPDSFRLDLPNGREWLDVMDHPPAREQIEAMLEEAKDKGWTSKR